MSLTTYVTFEGLGNRLKLRRQSMHITQEQLAEMLHTSMNQISRVERGRAKPSLPLILDWCSVLKLSLDALFFTSPHISDETIDILQKIDHLDEHERTLIMLYIDHQISGPFL